jgi:hypothetical protein
VAVGGLVIDVGGCVVGVRDGANVGAAATHLPATVPVAS